MTPIDLITISRDYGAGGSDVARELGHVLAWPVLDHDVVHRVAERLALDEATVERLDEHPPTLLARVAAVLLVAPPEAPAPVDTRQVLRPDAIAEAADAAIREAAMAPPLIVVGHGSQCIFGDRRGALHVRLAASLPTRVERLRRRLGVSAERAAAQAQRMDADRDHYVSRYYHRDRRDPLLYDLCIDTGRVALGEVVELVAGLVRARAAFPHRASPDVTAAAS
jgi:CMP/dCMP kinase